MSPQTASTSRSSGYPARSPDAVGNGSCLTSSRPSGASRTSSSTPSAPMASASTKACTVFSAAATDAPLCPITSIPKYGLTVEQHLLSTYTYMTSRSRASHKSPLVSPTGRAYGDVAGRAASHTHLCCFNPSSQQPDNLRGVHP